MSRMSAEAGTEAPVALRRHPPFRLFWRARVATTIAYQMQAVAIGWQVYDLTGSALDLGLVGLAQFVPGFALALVVGHIADRYDRRLVLRLCQVVEMLATAALALGSALGWLTTGWLFAAVFVIGGARACESPTLHALMPQLVPAALIPRAAAASSSANQTAIVLGPALGGLAYGLGPATPYALSCGAYLLANVLVSLIRIELPPPRREKLSLTSLFLGVAFIRDRPAVLGAISLDLAAVLLGGATALLPIFARDVFAVGPWGLGLLRASPAVGALAISLVLMRRPLRTHVGRSMFAAVAAFGVATVVFAWSTSFALTLVALAVLGASDMVSIVIRQTLIQLETPDAMRGRVSAVNTLFVGTANRLGDFRAGAMAAWLGTVPAVLVGGFGTLVMVAVCAKVFPALFRVERFPNG